MENIDTSTRSPIMITSETPLKSTKEYQVEVPMDTELAQDSTMIPYPPGFSKKQPTDSFKTTSISPPTHSVILERQQKPSGNDAVIITKSDQDDFEKRLDSILDNFFKNFTHPKN